MPWLVRNILMGICTISQPQTVSSSAAFLAYNLVRGETVPTVYAIYIQCVTEKFLY